MKLLFTILAVLATISAFGQNFKKIEYQFDLGSTITIPFKKTIELWPEFKGHPKTDYNFDLGYFLEFLISYNFNQKVAIISGLNFNYNNLKIDDNVGFVESKGDLTISYLHLPVLVNYQLFNHIPLTLSTGPYLGLLLAANEKGTSYIDTTGFVYLETNPEFQPVNSIQNYSREVKNNYTSFDFGLTLQGNYKIKLNQRLEGMVFARLNYGLKDVITNKVESYNTASYWRNYNLLIGLGIKL
jgi:hypothetical protein